MSEYALPCIVCGKKLKNVFAGSNQPSDGIVVMTTGNYGSTVWDSMNGEFLEFNVCDPCLREAAEHRRILVARTQKPVNYGGFRVGSTKTPYRPVEWTPGMEPLDNGIEIDDDDLDDPRLEINQEALDDARKFNEQHNN